MVVVKTRRIDADADIEHALLVGVAGAEGTEAGVNDGGFLVGDLVGKIVGLGVALLRECGEVALQFRGEDIQQFLSGTQRDAREKEEKT
jgi:hypothetical protein